MRLTAVLVWLGLLVSLPAQAQENTYWRQLVQKSREMKLAERQEWLNLLHFKPYPLWPGSRSLADDPAFFNAPDGKTNAAAELEATLKAFFSTIGETDKLQNPQCRFIARYHWLDQQLHFDPAQMKVQECKRFNDWKKALNPHEITLVFPAAYLNSPASMYGHTLLRIDAKEQDEHTRLLAYTVGYTASTNETNGLLFAWQGLTGGYPGIFQIMPYYMKVREYSDMENRDIWEYRLNLSEEEIDRAMMHIWELGPTYFAYYFLDENCAYHLLSILEVARPGLKLTDEFRWWAIPSDTVREVTEHANLLKEVVYRPSNATVIMQRLRELQPSLRTLAGELSTSRIQPDDPALHTLPLHEQAQVVELGQDYLTYMRASKGDWPGAAALSQKLLVARSELDTPAATPPVDTPKVRPDQGHKSLRAGIGGGNRDGVSYQELTIRPAYHDEADPLDGYIRGAEIQFFDIAVRHYGEEAGSRLERFVPIDIFSLASRNQFFRAMSWKANVGWARKRMQDGSEPLVSRLNAGGGYAWDAPSLDHPASQVYAMLEATLEGASQYERSYALGMGPSFGAVADITPHWRVDATAGVQRFALGDTHTVATISLLQSFRLAEQTAVRLQLSRKAEYDWYYTDGNISLQHYF